MAEANKMRSEASTSGSGGNDNSSGGSVVIDFGRRKSSCGYCKSGSRTSVSHGLWAQSLTVDDYQALLDRGWRRSGSFLYKPEMEKTCCPSYTIRLKASDFIPSKEQIRVSKRMQRFLDGQLDVKRSDKLLDEQNSCGGSCSNANNLSTRSAAKESLGADYEDHKADQYMHYASQKIDNIVQSCMKNGEFLYDIQLPKASVKKVAPAKRKLQAKELEDLVYSCNIAFQIAATLRKSKVDVEHTKSLERGVGGNRHSTELSPKLIAEILASQLKELAKSSGLSIRACNGHINFYSTTKQAHSVEESGNTKISTQSFTASGGNCCLKKTGGQPNGQKSTFEIRLKRSSFDYEEYSLYRKYQLRVHNDTPDQVSENSYKRFLVDTPLVYVPPSSDGAIPPSGFGSFHQQYVIDGKLIAVGVIDILPKCVSSKYLFWDPDFAFLSLGKFSALEEIRWVRENQVHCPRLQYYYLGYYIHSCSKMRYKAAYRPSELLCPLRYQWVPYDVAKILLDRRKYVVLSDFDPSQNGDSSSPPPTNVTDNYMEEQHDDPFQEGSIDVYVNDDEEMTELDSEDSDDESDSESNGPTTVESEDVDASNILIGLKGAHLRYKDLRQAFESSQRKFIETQLHRYQRVVGKELSERMAYSLG
ncbi:Arginyl-tRNA--protein transferase 1 [Forsythia ovata]|uniref:Arginyl-tRNA--protein transferase n=1 Tax=Forsythia ovata TaxID=205694 RepID=A0ABD1WLU7_9LAMI